VKVGERDVALERDQRQVARAEQRLEVGPGGVDALGGDIGTAIQDLVEDLQADVGLRDLVDLGKSECEAQARRPEVLANRTPLVAEIPARLLHEGEKTLVGLPVHLQHGGGEYRKGPPAWQRSVPPSACLRPGRSL
jgi:hypothetical protein